MSKVSFLGYVKDRLGGFEVDTGASSLAPSWQNEFDMFPEYYTDYFKKYSSAVSPLRRIICNGPITYIGQKLLQIDIDNLKAACEGLDVTDIFMPATGPSGFGRNDYYNDVRGVPARTWPRPCARSTSASSRPASSSRSTTRGSSTR